MLILKSVWKNKTNDHYEQLLLLQQFYQMSTAAAAHFLFFSNVVCCLGMKSRLLSEKWLTHNLICFIAVVEWLASGI